MTTTIESLITAYADRIGAASDVEVTDDDRTPAGFPGLLATCAQRLGTYYIHSYLSDAANKLVALDHYKEGSKKAQRILARVDEILDEAIEDLEMQ